MEDSVPQDDAATLDSLPDQLLGQCFSLVDRRLGGAAISLVCRRWRSVYFADPSVWATVRLETASLDLLTRRQQAAWVQAKRSLLSRVGPLVALLAVHDRTNALAVAAAAAAAASAAAATAAQAGEAGAAAGLGAEAAASMAHARPAGAAGAAGGAGGANLITHQAAPSVVPAWGASLADLLRLLSPAMLRDLELECHPSPTSDALDTLPRFAAHLTALNLDARQLPPAVSRVLPQLTALRSLRLGADSISCIDACTQLARLTRLELEASFFPLPHLTALSTLCQLAALRLADDSSASEPLLLPPPAQFRGGRGLAACTVFMRRKCQVAGSQLRYLHVGCADQASEAAASPSWAYVSLLGARETGGHPAAPAAPAAHPPCPLISLPALLAALVPACAQLRHLSLHSCHLDAADVAGCAQLAGLHHLGLQACTGGSWHGGFAAALAALLAATPNLSELIIESCLGPGGSVPACLAAKLGLASLSLYHNGISELPWGPYLAGLTHLDLSQNNLTCLPPSLASATSLESLSVESCHHLALTHAEVDALLLLLPGLQSVEVGDTQTAAEVAERLGRLLLQQRKEQGEEEQQGRLPA